MLFLLFMGICLGSTIAETTDNPPISEYDSFYPNTNWSDTIDWKLFKVFSKLQPGKNILISPISLKLALVLLYEGSSGTTHRELQSVMQFPPKYEIRAAYKKVLEDIQPRGGDVALTIATRIFMDLQIQPQETFLLKAKEHYKSDLQSVNFSVPINASASINTWIDKVTNGKIIQMISPEDLKDTIMIVANAVYFKGLWRHKFPKENTQMGKFYVSSTESITVPFLSTTDEFYFFESEVLEAKILRIPYKGGKYSMFIVLPMAKEGLRDLIKLINLRDLHRQMYFLDKSIVSVNIPKFKFDFQARFGKVLQDFGLQQMFQSTASFPGIAKGNNTLLRRLVVSDIVQKSGILVDEDGSEIYVATDITIGNKLGEVKNSFNATHPFFFFVEEETTGTILFIGKVENPADMDAMNLPQKSNDDDLYVNDDSNV